MYNTFIIPGKKNCIQGAVITGVFAHLLRKLFKRKVKAELRYLSNF